MKVRVDRDLCQGHGRCYVLAPTVFESDDDGYGTERAGDVAPQDHEAARKGAGNCPEDAITIREE